jgi:ferredoxin
LYTKSIAVEHPFFKLKFRKVRNNKKYVVRIFCMWYIVYQEGCKEEYSMPKINYSTSGKILDVPENSNILRMSLRYDGDLPNKCGGGICGSCLCKIEEGAEHLDNVKVQERRKLGEEWLEKGYRLGCQTFVTDGDVTISWDEETTKVVKKRKPDKIQKQVVNK